MTMNRNAAQPSRGPWFALACASGVAFMLTMIACQTAGSSVAAATDAERPGDDARQSKAGGQNKGQAQSPKAEPNSPEAVAAVMWGKVLTKCPVSGSPASTTTFFSYPREEGNPTWASLIEVREAWTKLLPEELSAADRLNGIQFRGFAILGGSAERYITTGKTRWSEWADISRHVAPKAAKAFRRETLVDWPGVFITIEQRNHQWSFSVLGHSDDVLQDSQSFNPDSMAAKTRSCAILTTVNPLEGR